MAVDNWARGASPDGHAPVSGTHRASWEKSLVHLQTPTTGATGRRPGPGRIRLPESMIRSRPGPPGGRTMTRITAPSRLAWPAGSRPRRQRRVHPADPGRQRGGDCPGWLDEKELMEGIADRVIVIMGSALSTGPDVNPAPIHGACAGAAAVVRAPAPAPSGAPSRSMPRVTNVNGADQKADAEPVTLMSEPLRRRPSRPSRRRP